MTERTYGVINRKSLLQSAFLVIGVSVISLWGIGKIPFDKLPLSHFWGAMIYRAFTALLWAGVLFALKPKVARRIFVVKDYKNVLAGLGVVAMLMLPSLFHTSYKGRSLSMIFEGFIFALFIGIDEEIFSRGMVFTFLEKYGVRVAAIVSSVHFGLLHLGNAIWGGQSFAYTAGQVVDAAAFGYLCCGLLMFTGTIWVPILLHGLTDFPMQMQTAAVYVHEVTGGTPWAPVIFESFLYGLLGWSLMYLSRLDQSTASPLAFLTRESRRPEDSFTEQ